MCNPKLFAFDLKSRTVPYIFFKLLLFIEAPCMHTRTGTCLEDEFLRISQTVTDFLRSCNTLCMANKTCHEYSYNPETKTCALFRNGCSLSLTSTKFDWFTCPKGQICISNYHLNAYLFQKISSFCDMKIHFEIFVPGGV